MARIFLTGGSGLLALNWACTVRSEHEVVLATHTRKVRLARTTALPIALEDTDALSRALCALRPDIVVHTAALSHVDDCERDPQNARFINVALTRNVARAAAAAGAKLVHISTDLLFCGARAFLTEAHPPEPLNVYANIKVEAEHVVAAECPDALIVRTNVFGWGHRYRESFSDWIYYNLKAGHSIRMFDDMYNTPILADRIATAVHALVEHGARGVFNVVGDERVSKYEFGLRLARAFALPESLIVPAQTESAGLLAKRPLDMSLDNSRARAVLGRPLGTTAEYLELLKAQDAGGRREELLEAVAPASVARRAAAAG